jgi:NIPSNAP protein
MPRTTQLRTYTIRQGMLDEWLRRWQEGVVPLRQEYGFEIIGAWLDREESRFVWVLAYDGPETFEEVNDRFWASPERLAMRMETDDYIVGWDMRMVEEITL